MKTHCDTTIWLGSDGATVEVTAVETCAWAHLGSHVLIHTDGTNLALVPAAEDERS